MNLKYTILNYYLNHEVTPTDIDHSIKVVHIQDSNKWIGDLKITGYNNLRIIEVKKDSLMNIRSLTITNNPSLDIVSFQMGSCKHIIILKLLSMIVLTYFTGSSSPIYPRC